MKLNPFKKDPHQKEKTAVMKDVRAEIGDKIKEVEKLPDPVKRIEGYQSVLEDLQVFYDSGKSKGLDRKDTVKGGAAGTVGGFVTGTAVGLITAITLPFVGVPVLLGVMGTSMAAGAASGAGLKVDREEQKKLRTKYGSVRNARALYKLQDTLEKRIEKDSETIKAQTLRERFHETFRKDKTAPAETPAKTLPANDKPVVKLVRKPKAP
jgi:hypothetical protein